MDTAVWFFHVWLVCFKWSVVCKVRYDIVKIGRGELFEVDGSQLRGTHFAIASWRTAWAVDLAGKTCGLSGYDMTEGILRVGDDSKKKRKSGESTSSIPSNVSSAECETSQSPKQNGVDRQSIPDQNQYSWKMIRQMMIDRVWWCSVLLKRRSKRVRFSRAAVRVVCIQGSIACQKAKKKRRVRPTTKLNWKEWQAYCQTWQANLTTAQWDR